MRMTKRSGGFFFCLILNMLMNTDGLIPAALLLVLHFWKGWSLWWSVGAAGIWLLVIVLRMLLLTWASRCGSEPTPYQENKNPYSVGNSGERR